MEHDEFLLAWTGAACRHVPDTPNHDVLDFRFAGQVAFNRWNGSGQPTVYLAGDHGVALAEFARHYRTDSRPEGAQKAVVRRLYDVRVTLDRVVDLRDPRLLAAMRIDGAPACFLDRANARAIATDLRGRTAAQAIVVPSVAFLDDPGRWVMALFLEKLPADPGRFLTEVRADGTFRVEP